MRSICFLLLLNAAVCANAQQDMDSTAYTLIIKGFDWGPAVESVVIPARAGTTTTTAADYEVSVKRSSTYANLEGESANGPRRVLEAFPSDANGNRSANGAYFCLLMEVGPDVTLASPIHYFTHSELSGNHWILYEMDIRDKKHDYSWNEEADRFMPLIDEFDPGGLFNYEEDKTLTYADYKPGDSKTKRPLIIWLHGGGEGGKDPTIPLIANRAANYASEEIQSIFGGAYVLVPQTPTFWMQNAEGDYTTGETNDVYNQALMDLIRQYIAENPGIDSSRIYVGGCSNGGYMSLKLLLLEPDFFAAAFISALAYQSEYISDEEIRSISELPIWFLHAADDEVTRPEITVLPVYNRLVAAGAKDVHLSYYDHVTDISGRYGGAEYHYNGHFSWIYSHANHARLEIDGKETTIMEWMASRHRTRP